MQSHIRDLTKVIQERNKKVQRTKMARQQPTILSQHQIVINL